MPTTEVDDFLAHFGVLGMHWGVRKEQPASKGTESKDKSKGFSWDNPKVKVAAAAAIGVTAIVAGGLLASRFKVKLKDIPVDLGKAKAAAEKIIDDPQDIIYLSKPFKGSGTRTTLGFVSEGKTKDFFTIFDKAGLNDDSFGVGEFRKLKNGQVAAILADSAGRLDDATRPIFHAVLIPADKAVGLNSIDDVITKFGPQMEKEYAAFVAARLAKQPNF